MPTRPRSPVTARWTIHSVPVRTRDGAERRQLDNAARVAVSTISAAAGSNHETSDMRAQQAS